MPTRQPYPRKKPPYTRGQVTRTRDTSPAYNQGVDFGLRRALAQPNYPRYSGGTPTPGQGIGGPAMPEDNGMGGADTSGVHFGAPAMPGLGPTRAPAPSVLPPQPQRGISRQPAPSITRALAAPPQRTYDPLAPQPPMGMVPSGGGTSYEDILRALGLI